MLRPDMSCFFILKLDDCEEKKKGARAIVDSTQGLRVRKSPETAPRGR